MKYTTPQQAKDYIYSFIAKSTRYKHTGAFGLERMKFFLSLLGNPQDAVPIIHVAGTSGKGSTSYILSVLLKAHGFRVGLHVKPHIKDVRERFQINNELISDEDFIRYVNHIAPVIEQVKQSEFGSPSYTEIVTALAYVVFADKKVEYAVIETLMGGRLDYTNTTTRKDKVAVITRIGFDHTKILGNTLAKIAYQKVGIVHEQNLCISLAQKQSAHVVIENETRELNAPLLLVAPKTNYDHVKQISTGITFDFKFQTIHLPNLMVSLYGTYQAENTSLALATLIALAQRDSFAISEQHIRSSLQMLQFVARFDVLTVQGKKVVIDGAHNPQKMKAFITSLQRQYPKGTFHFLIAFLKEKDIKRMLEVIKPVAEQITITSFFHEHQEWIKKSEEPSVVAELINNSNVQIFTEKSEALRYALSHTSNILVITGSMYFIGEMYPEVLKLDRTS